MGNGGHSKTARTRRSGATSACLTADRQPATTALRGIRVVELGAFQLAPLAARWLGEAGADVIKIETLPGGDPIRGIKTLVNRGRSPDTHNWFHEYLNQGKRSVALNMGDERASQVARTLVGKADVFVTNLKESTLARWALDYESLAGSYPGLVYAQGTGYGTEGPDASQPALDMMGQARSGMLGVAGDPQGISMAGGLTPCDRIAGLQLAYGALLALMSRQQTGFGQKVDASLLGAGLYLVAHELQFFLGTAETSLPVTRKGVANPLRNLYQTGDGKWLVFNMSQGDRYWPEFCKALGIDHLRNDARFESMVERSRNRTELIAVLERVFSTKTRAEWEQVLGRHDLLWATVKSVPEVAVDPQVTENGYVTSSPDEHQTVNVIGPLVGLRKTPLKLGNVAPELGQHTEEVLMQIGGYGWDELSTLKEAGVII